MSYQVMPSVFSPNTAQVYKHPIAPPAVQSDINGRAESVRREPNASAPSPLPPSSASFGGGTYSFFA